jgi:glycosyltransferase involved in cell wall biosynthesis
MSAMTAVVVRTGRSSYGELRRTESWAKLFRASGAICHEVTILDRTTTRPNLAGVGPVLLGSRVPEVLVWDAAGVLEKVRRFEPDVVVLQTARTYQPLLASGPWVTVLDLVDRLSLSYRQRAGLSRGPRSLAYAALARSHASFEAAAYHAVPRVVAAGRSDAAALGARWMPNLVDPAACPVHRGPREFDAVFFGSLGYRPNVEALEWVAEATPSSRGLRLLIAGHAPSDRVRGLCRDQRWVLEENYPANEWLADRATLAIAPLRSAAGIQNKVIEAAMVGLPQVVTSPALAGLATDFPACVSDTAEGFVDQIEGLLADEQERRRLTHAAWAHTRDNYTVDAWVPALWDLIEADRGGERPSFVEPRKVSSGTP